MKTFTKIILGIVLLIGVHGAIGAALGQSPKVNTTTALQSASTTSYSSSKTAQTSKSTPSQSYEDTTYNFRVQVPALWVIFKDPTQNSEESAANLLPVLSVHPPNPQEQTFGGSFGIYVDTSPGVNSSSAYVGIYKEKLAQMNSNFGVTFNSITNDTLGGSPAYLVSYVIHFPSSLGGDCAATDVVAMHNGTGYILTFDDCNAQQENADVSPVHGIRLQSCISLMIEVRLPLKPTRNWSASRRYGKIKIAR